MGSRILAGRYELLEKIGEGGMAVVFKAKDRLLSRDVAIKILRPEFTKDAVFIESFRRESQMAAGLNHPNIVNIYDVGKEGNIYYIVMELIEGEPLSDIIKREGALDPKRAATITKQIASGLSLAHKNHLIHRDVKPHNIMITSDGVAKITDFGIAKNISGETLVGDKKENVMGSVHYFSPEQARGGYVDEKSDVYSLGICLYEMLTGKVPFDGETAVEVAVKHMNEPMIPPSQLNPDIPQDLEDIVMKATNKVQINRYRNMDEMITDLNFVKYSKHSSIAVANEVAAANAAAAAGEKASGKEDSSAKEEKKKFFHPQRYLAVILAVLLAVPASALAARLFIKDSSESTAESQTQAAVAVNKEVKVPDLTNLSFEEAEAELDDMGLGIEIEMQLSSTEYEEGHIMSQTPSKDATVKTGQTIKVTISKGETLKTVPGVEGKKLADAKYVLETYGYKVGSISQAENSVPEGYVCSQSPKKGTTLETGGVVNLVVSLGSPEAEGIVLNLIYTDYDEAVAIIEEQGLTLGTVSYSSSDDIPAGAVMKQNPSEESTIEKGATVNLVVSTGPVNNPDGSGSETTSEGGITTDPGTETGTETGSETETGTEAAQSTVSIEINFSSAQSDEFKLTVNVSDDVNGARTPVSRRDCNKADSSTVVNISGSGHNGKAYVFFDNELVSEYNIDFDAGTVTLQ